MPFLIDGHNLLFRLRRGDEEEGQLRRALIELLRRDALENQRRYVVVFDGRGRYSTRREKGVVEVVYSSAQEDADAIMEHIVEDQPHYYVLVTADKVLSRKLRRQVQRVESPREFLSRLAGKREESRDCEKREVADVFEVRYWLRLFEQGEIG